MEYVSKNWGGDAECEFSFIWCGLCDWVSYALIFVVTVHISRIAIMTMGIEGDCTVWGVHLGWTPGFL
jgi:hypothetical protein